MQRDKWRIGPLIHEAVRNVFDIRAKLFPALVLAALAGSGLATISAIEASGLQTQLADLQLDGRLVYNYTSQDPEIPVKIDRQSCEALTNQAGVERAGLVINSGFFDVPQLGTGVMISRASATLFPELHQAGALVGSALRDPGPDFNLQLPDGFVSTATIMPEQPKGIDTNSSVIVPLDVLDTTGGSCRVIFNSYSDTKEAADRALASLRVEGSAPLAANSAYQENINPITTYLSRVSRFLPLLIGLLGGFAAAVIDRVRLSEFAAYRLSGTSGRTLAALILTEQALLGGTLASAAAAGSVVTGLLGYPISPDAVVLSGLASGLTWTIAGCLFTIDIPWRQPTNLAKDR
ncbi:hypothetical protein [Rarobacter incanus]|uniref:FtsX-like permease family protein n=1 Tax=Rarobacter incanus TaxID=153494 RepID=A0A542SPI5_9MICO|nr:hypothetical protein [Rarobacter incanus]TQK76533.1 hypothetical protein FB389_1212 [Rarobacter incanus]